MHASTTHASLLLLHSLLLGSALFSPLLLRLQPPLRILRSVLYLAQQPYISNIALLSSFPRHTRRATMKQSQSNKSPFFPCLDFSTTLWHPSLPSCFAVAVALDGVVVVVETRERRFVTLCSFSCRSSPVACVGVFRKNECGEGQASRGGGGRRERRDEATTIAGGGRAKRLNSTPKRAATLAARDQACKARRASGRLGVENALDATNSMVAVASGERGSGPCSRRDSLASLLWLLSLLCGSALAAAGCDQQVNTTSSTSLVKALRRW